MAAEKPKIRFNDQCSYVDFDGAVERVPFGEWEVDERPLFCKVTIGPREIQLPTAALEQMLSEWKAKRLAPAKG